MNVRLCAHRPQMHPHQFEQVRKHAVNFVHRPNKQPTIVDKFVGTNMEDNNILKKYSDISSQNRPPFPQRNVDKNLIHCGDNCHTYCNNIVLGE